MKIQLLKQKYRIKKNRNENVEIRLQKQNYKSTHTQKCSNKIVRTKISKYNCDSDRYTSIMLLFIGFWI